MVRAPPEIALFRQEAVLFLFTARRGTMHPGFCERKKPVGPITLSVIAVSLAMDAFAVAIAVSVVLVPVQPRQVFRLSFHFGLFQALMPLIGWTAGRTVAGTIASYDHWVAFAILAFVGAKAIWGSLRNDEEHSLSGDPTRGWSLVMLSVATSVDALAVGLSFSFLHVPIWSAVILIGLVAAASTVLGMNLGSRLGIRVGRGIELVGGIVLLGIGTHIVLDHLSIL